MEKFLRIIERKVNYEIFSLIEMVLDGESEEDLVEFANNIEETSKKYVELSSGDLLFIEDIRRLGFKFEYNMETKKNCGHLLINYQCSDKINLANTTILLNGDLKSAKKEFESLKSIL